MRDPAVFRMAARTDTKRSWPRPHLNDVPLRLSWESGTWSRPSGAASGLAARPRATTRGVGTDRLPQLLDQARRDHAGVALRGEGTCQVARRDHIDQRFQVERW